MLKLIYVTLNNSAQAQAISHALIEAELAACTNWYPITSVYRWEGTIRQDSEIVLIVKTKQGNFEAISNLIKQYINYTNCITEISTENTNPAYLAWVNSEVK